MAKKEEVSEDLKLEDLGFRKAGQLIDQFKTKRCYFIEPISLALAFARRDPITGLPGVPQGSIIEGAGKAGSLKSTIAERHAIHVLADDPQNKVAFLNFEYPDQERWGFLEAHGFDRERIYSLDYSNPELTSAEDGLNALLSVAIKFPEVKLVVIDSFGMMAVEKEIKDKDTGEITPIESKQQMAIRATRIKAFLLRWNCLNPNTRPTLMVLNHMYNQLRPEGGGFGMDPLKVDKIGEDLNYQTPGGNVWTYIPHMRFRTDAKKWPEPKDAVKHEYTEGKVYDCLASHIEVYRNKYLPGRHWCYAIYNMEDRTNCHFEIELELLNICDHLEVGEIFKRHGKRWEIKGKSYTTDAAVKLLRDDSVLKWSLIRECGMPRNPERFHNPKGKKSSTNGDKV